MIIILTKSRTSLQLPVLSYLLSVTPSKSFALCEIATRMVSGQITRSIFLHALIFKYYLQFTHEKFSVYPYISPSSANTFLISLKRFVEVCMKQS